ncbi:D-alanyl-D-alanine carboxypeptidase [Pseudoruegeria sp. SHC-113]|nr:D-alanyl-D-alanine carboxypeptidase family protein [Pseudoruegeria sp. SHC-113]MCT8159357.1 D-alanyl-D-alanine carboxypeptidase [Pseudoruegeria sp. SHC-113]
MLKAAATAMILALPLPAFSFETAATAAYVIDQTTGTVLLEKRADVALPPASMSKLMTLNMLFEALKDGRVTMETRFPVSSRAKAMGGSTMFLNERDRPTVEELILGIIVQSGNDACVVVAEGLAGSEATFATQMNARAQALGMTNSTFANASGWPHPSQRMSMHDLGVLAQRLINDFPEYYPYFAQTEFPFDGRSPDNRFNRNPLLKLGIGADGLKTGHTQEAGYGLVGSAKQGSRRVTFVITGLDSERARAEEAERVVSWAFRQFVEKTVATAGTQVASAKVWMGASPSVGLVPTADATLLVPALSHGDLTATVEHKSPLEAPIAKGDEIGTLVVQLEGMPDARIPLVADRDVARGGFLPRLRAAAQVLYRQVMGEAQADTLASGL